MEDDGTPTLYAVKNWIFLSLCRTERTCKANPRRAVDFYILFTGQVKNRGQNPFFFPR